VNRSLKGCDRSLVIGGEPEDVVAVGEGLRLHRTEGLLISRHRGELDTQEGVEPLEHIVA
jgi:hypothetical protein